MTKLGRLHGAILIEIDNQYFLVGDLKEPADFEAAGFADPGEILPLQNHFIALSVNGKIKISEHEFTCKQSGDEFLEKAFHRFVIKRNGSVSNRLWNLLLNTQGRNVTVSDISWLFEMPDSVWEIVQDQILRCV